MYIYIYIYTHTYKEELKTVVCELLTCTQLNRHKTFTALQNPYHNVSSRGRRAQIHFSGGARSQKPENDCPPFWFYRESMRFCMHSSHIVIVEAPSQKCHRWNAVNGALQQWKLAEGRLPLLVYRYIYIQSREASCILQNGGTFSMLYNTQHLIAKPSVHTRLYIGETNFVFPQVLYELICHQH